MDMPTRTGKLGLLGMGWVWVGEEGTHFLYVEGWGVGKGSKRKEEPPRLEPTRAGGG
jgi:hypothetical protein